MPLPGVQRRIRSFGMSENKRQPASPNQTGPSTQSKPVASCFTGALPSTKVPNTGSMTSKKDMVFKSLPYPCLPVPTAIGTDDRNQARTLRGATRPMAFTADSLTLTDDAVLAMLTAARDEAARMGRPQCIVVADASAVVLGSLRMTGAKVLSLRSATAKARTAASTGGRAARSRRRRGW